MPKALEIELKLDVDAAGLRRIADSLAVGGDQAPDAMAAVYLDTPEQGLRAAGLTLRVRSENGRRVQTLKGPSHGAAGLLARDEWEWPIDGDASQQAMLVEPLETLLPALHCDVDVAALVPQFQVNVTRRVFDVHGQDADIEIACDAGEIVAAGLRAPLSEVELELKRGDPAALFALARRLDDVAPLRLGVLAKAERGYLLCAGQAAAVKAAPLAVKAAPLALARDMTPAAALHAIANNCLVQFRRNEALVMRSGDMEAVHQCRVGLRRLRTALGVFARAFPRDHAIGRLRIDLRRVAQHLAMLRNLDVLIERGMKKAADEAADEAADLAFMQPLRRARTAALARAKIALASRPVRRTMLDLAEWLATGPDMRGGDTDARIRAFARDCLDRLRRRLLKRGRHFATLDDPARHRLRIRAKQLRYASEFFRSLFDGGRRYRQFIAPLAVLQRHLGDLNDRAVVPMVLADMGFVEGIEPIVASFEARAAMLAGAETALSALAEVRPFWRGGRP